MKQVIAAAGSGKTRTVIGLVEYRLRQRLERAGRVLLLSFSRKAAGEIRERLPDDLRGAAEISTFHSFCYRHLMRLDPVWRRRPPRLLDEAEKQDFLFAELRRWRDAIGGIPFETLLRRPALFRAQFPEAAFHVYRALAVWKRESERIEYEDLIERMLDGLERRADHLEELRRGYDLIIVDEFQDTDPRQLEFLRSMQAPRLVVVGDDWQAIYGFRGATLQPFLDFARHFRGARQYRLAENYRSTTDIVRTGNRAIKASSHQLRKRVVAVRGRGPRLPVLRIETPAGRESELVAELGTECDFRVLVRSNFRREIWIQAGLPAERVLTIHKSKGLEFPVVLLDLVGGWSGALEAEEDDRVPDEEIRVLYVGLSRAENLLVILRKDGYRPGDPERNLLERALSRGSRRVRPEALPAFLEQERRYRCGEEADE